MRRYYLSGDVCEEVVVLQVRDRAGFAQFTARLAQLGVAFTTTEVSPELFDTAQTIGRGRGVLLSSGNSTDAAADREGGESAVRVAVDYDFRAAIRHAQRTTNSATAFRWPADELNALPCGDEEDGWIRGLLTTSREAFTVLTATKASR